jgi:hypothetical protein
MTTSKGSRMTTASKAKTTKQPCHPNLRAKAPPTKGPKMGAMGTGRRKSPVASSECQQWDLFRDDQKEELLTG